jgi:hypothetical protein
MAIDILINMIGLEQAKRLIEQLSKALEENDAQLNKLKADLVDLANKPSQASQQAGKTFSDYQSVVQYIQKNYPNAASLGSVNPQAGYLAEQIQHLEQVATLLARHVATGMLDRQGPLPYRLRLARQEGGSEGLSRCLCLQLLDQGLMGQDRAHGFTGQSSAACRHASRLLRPRIVDALEEADVEEQAGQGRELLLVEHEKLHQEDVDQERIAEELQRAQARPC